MQIILTRESRELTYWPPGRIGVKSCSRITIGAFGGTGRMEATSKAGAAGDAGRCAVRVAARMRAANPLSFQGPIGRSPELRISHCKKQADAVLSPRPLTVTIGSLTGPPCPLARL